MRRTSSEFLAKQMGIEQPMEIRAAKKTPYEKAKKKSLGEGSRFKAVESQARKVAARL